MSTSDNIIFYGSALYWGMSVALVTFLGFITTPAFILLGIIGFILMFPVGSVMENWRNNKIAQERGF